MRRKHRRLLKVCAGMVALLAAIGMLAWHSGWHVRIRAGREIHFVPMDFAFDELLNRGDLQGISEYLKKRPEMASACALTGDSYLMIATDRNNPDLVKLLLDHGAVVDVQDKWGSTPLQLAGFRGFAEVAKLLLNAGANPDLPDKAGKSFRDLARKDPTLQMLLDQSNTRGTPAK